MTRVARRLLTLAAAVAVLSGCGMVVSRTPIFPERMAAADPALEGLYTVRGNTTSDVAVVTRNDTHYTAAFYRHVYSAAPNAKPYAQSGAADFQLIPLDNGDYAVQASCAFAMIGAGLFAARDHAPPDQVQYAVLIAARPRQNFWLGIMPGGKGFEDFARRNREAGASNDDTVDLSGIDPQTALALFRDWRSALVDAGGEAVSPIVHVADQSWETQAPNDPNPQACREMAQNARRMEKDRSTK